MQRCGLRLVYRMCGKATTGPTSGIRQGAYFRKCGFCRVGIAHLSDRGWALPTLQIFSPIAFSRSLSYQKQALHSVE